jgi:HK97 gp10 family phage protein
MVVQGDKHLMQAFTHIAVQARRRVARAAVMKGARLVRKETASQARSKRLYFTGNLYEGLKARNAIKFTRTADAFIATVGAAWWHAPHSHLVEKGSKDRTRKSGGSTGRMPAQPFAEPAWDASRKRAARVILSTMWDGILKEVDKMRKKG